LAYNGMIIELEGHCLARADGIGESVMAQLDYVTRSLVRAAAFRAMRRAPVWVALGVLAAGWFLEHMR
jgi:hypothetical protein